MICRSFWWDSIVPDRFVGWLTHFFCSASMCHSQPSHVQLGKIRKTWISIWWTIPDSAHNIQAWKSMHICYIDIIKHHQAIRFYLPRFIAIHQTPKPLGFHFEATTWRWSTRLGATAEEGERTAEPGAEESTGLGIEWYGSRVKLPH